MPSTSMLMPAGCMPLAEWRLQVSFSWQTFHQQELPATSSAKPEKSTESIIILGRGRVCVRAHMYVFKVWLNTRQREIRIPTAQSTRRGCRADDTLTDCTIRDS